MFLWQMRIYMDPLLYVSASVVALLSVIHALWFSRLISLCFDLLLSLHCFSHSLFHLMSFFLPDILAPAVLHTRPDWCADNTVICTAFWSIFSFVAVAEAAGTWDWRCVITYSSPWVMSVIREDGKCCSVEAGRLDECTGKTVSLSKWAFLVDAMVEARLPAA